MFSCILNKVPANTSSKKFVLKFDGDCESLGDFNIVMNIGLVDTVLDDFFSFSHLSKNSNIQLIKNNLIFIY